MEILDKCKDYEILKKNFDKEILEDIDKILVDFREYSTKNDNGENDIIEEYCEKYGNYDIITWEQGILDTEDFIYLLDKKLNMCKDVREVRQEKIERILYAVQSEFENEVDSISDIFGRKISDKELDFGFELLNNYINKVKLIIKDYLESEEF